MGRVLAVDLGTRRVGLAVSDPTRTLATPLDTWPFRGEAKLVVSLLGECRDRHIEQIVIGSPANEGRRQNQVADMAARVAQVLRDSGAEVTVWDESFTSRRAEAALREVGVTRRRRPGAIDRVAAALLLQSYLEAGAGQASTSTD